MKERIALGFGNNVDYEIVWNSRIFENLITQYDIGYGELDINRVIRSERDLVISILSFLKIGSGGERFVATSAIIEHFSQNFEKKITLGGTSVRAAITMRKFGYTSTLHLVTTNDYVRSLIPHDSPHICSNTQDSAYPHLIVQFGKDTCVKANDINICASQANRLIYHSDDDNIAMNLNEDFSDLITDAKVLLLSGFNAMQSKQLLTDRLGSVLRIIEHLPKDALVYYEDAGYFEPSFSRLIYRTIEIDIFSLNEDELQAYLNRKLDLLDVLQVKDALVDLQNLIPVPIIVVHTRYWALAYGEKAQRFSKALKAGITMATTRFCHGDNFTIQNYKEIERLSPDKDNTIFADTINKLLGDKIYCVPVAHVEPPTATTVGLGDTFVGGFLPALLD
jgi:ADP-dependent phosphofructokinase/glucokinase